MARRRFRSRRRSRRTSRKWYVKRTQSLYYDRVGRRL